MKVANEERSCLFVQFELTNSQLRCDNINVNAKTLFPHYLFFLNTLFPDFFPDVSSFPQTVYGL